MLNLENHHNIQQIPVFIRFYSETLYQIHLCVTEICCQNCCQNPVNFAEESRIFNELLLILMEFVG